MRANKKKKFNNKKLKVFFSRGFIVYFAVAVIIIFVVGAVFAGSISTYNPNKNDLHNTLQGMSSQHILGTDLFGRDVFTRLLYGTRVSLIASIASCALAAVVGMFLGLLSGYYQGACAQIILHYVDIQLSIPPLLFTLIISLFMGHGIFGLIIALGFGMIPGFIRLMHSTILTIKNSDFIVALKLGNISDFKIIFKHLLPNTFAPMVTMFAMNLGFAILLEATISFIGLGIQQPAASWGNMVSDGQKYLLTHPLLCAIPGICVVLLTVAFNVIGDSLADALNPRLRGKL